MGVTLDPNSLVKAGKQNAVSLGNLTKTVSRWTVGLGWDPAKTQKVDCDLWMVALTTGEAIELVRYNENDATARVVSRSGALEYLGDDQTGESSDGGDDEQGLIHLDKLAAAGADQVLILANIYKPGNLTFDHVQNAYVRIFPGDDESKAQAIALTEKGVGARTVIFGWLERTGTGLTDWDFVNQPSHATDIQTALAPFGVG